MESGGLMKKFYLLLTLLSILIAANACSKDKEKGIYSSGQVTIRSTWACDLDKGVEASNYVDEDFEWSNAPPHYLEPANNAKFFKVGTINLDSVVYDALTGYTYSASIIQESQLPVGTVLAGITKQGRYCKFRIDANDPNLTITWVTYEL
jgi:hypothetical protein